TWWRRCTSWEGWRRRLRGYAVRSCWRRWSTWTRCGRVWANRGSCCRGGCEGRRRSRQALVVPRPPASAATEVCWGGPPCPPSYVRALWQGGHCPEGARSAPTNRHRSPLRIVTTTGEG